MEFQASVEFQAAALLHWTAQPRPSAFTPATERIVRRAARPYWRRCRCLKYLYIYQNGTSRQISARTRSWEKAEQKAHEIRASIDATNQLRRQLEAKIQGHDSQVEISAAAEEFLKEVSRLNRAEATRKKYKLTLDRMSTCVEPNRLLFSCCPSLMFRRSGDGFIRGPKLLRPVITSTSESLRFSVSALNRDGSRRIRPNESRRCRGSRMRLCPLLANNTMPSLSTHYYDGRGQERNGETTNSRRVRAYLKLLRWSGLRAGDAACLAKSKLREDDSLVLYQAKVKNKASPLSAYCSLTK
jgi:hypothetical protein